MELSVDITLIEMNSRILFLRMLFLNAIHLSLNRIYHPSNPCSVRHGYFFNSKHSKWYVRRITGLITISECSFIVSSPLTLITLLIENGSNERLTQVVHAFVWTHLNFKWYVATSDCFCTILEKKYTFSRQSHSLDFSLVLYIAVCCLKSHWV